MTGLSPPAQTELDMTRGRRSVVAMGGALDGVAAADGGADDGDGDGSDPAGRRGDLLQNGDHRLGLGAERESGPKLPGPIDQEDIGRVRHDVGRGSSASTFA